MGFSWTLFIDLGLISVALLLATLIRAKVPLFQRFLIPNALTAGFMLLPVYNFVLPRLGLDSGGLGNLVYHLLSISFVAMSLREGNAKGSGRRIFTSASVIIGHYTIQTIVGMGITLLLMFTLIPGLFPSFGFLLPLGFGLGPGQAYAIAKGWEPLGFVGGGDLGIIFAAIGYLWGSFGGIVLVNTARRRGWMDSGKADQILKKSIRTGMYGRDEERPVGSRLTTDTEAVDTLSYDLGVVLGVYLVTYLLLQLVTWLLSFAGPTGTQLANNLWGIAFVFAAALALLVKKIFRAAGIGHTLEGGSLTRIAGASVDFMVTAAVAAIAIVVLKQYWLPVLVVTTLGGIVTTVSVLWICSRAFKDHRFDWALMMFGNMTGTVSTGLAFLRVVDPDYETPVATEYMYSTGLTFVLAIPYILMLNLPGYWYSTGNLVYLWLTLAGLGLYLVFSVVSYAMLAGKDWLKSPRQLWLKKP